jgi:hypothetical protein
MAGRQEIPMTQSATTMVRESIDVAESNDAIQELIRKELERFDASSVEQNRQMYKRMMTLAFGATIRAGMTDPRILGEITKGNT